MFVFSRSINEFITAYVLLVVLLQRTTLNYLCLFISINDTSGFGGSSLQRCDQPDSICSDLLNMFSAAGQMQLLGSSRCCYCSSSIILRSTLKEHIFRSIFSPLPFFFFFCALIFLLPSTVNWKMVISTSPMLLLWPR